jgi:hypothetical protein
MEKVLFLLAEVVLGTLSANAQKEADLFTSAGDAKSITLSSDVKVVFVHAEAQDDVKISKEAMPKLHVNFENGTLRLEQQKKRRGDRVCFGEQTIESNDWRKHGTRF